MFSNEEYADMQLVYGEALKNTALAIRIYRERFPNRRLPNARTFMRVDRSLRETGSFTGHVRERGRNSNNNSEQVISFFEDNPEESTRSASRFLGIAKSTIWRILNKEKFHAFHIQKVQSMEILDPERRRTFCSIFLQKLRFNPDFLEITLFSDEATFTRDGIFNYHNWHYWAKENPHVISERNHQWGFKINVWCGIIGKILLLFFIKN